MTSATPTQADLTIEPLTPDRLGDLAALFHQPGDPKWCWCANFFVCRRVKGVASAVNRAILEERAVWSIVCFVVARKERGQGIAGALLDAAIGFARANGATTLEAYPADTGGGHLPPPLVFRGTLSMFERAGFTEVARRQASASVAPRPIVRLEL